MSEIEKKYNIDELQYIKGVGPVKAKALIKAGLDSPFKLINYFPRTYIDRNALSSIRELSDILKMEDYNTLSISDFGTFKSDFTIVVKVISKKFNTFAKNRKLLKLIVTDSSNYSAEINFWNKAQFFDMYYKVGQLLAVSGKPEQNEFQKISFTHPEIDIIEEEDAELYKTGGIIPKYRISEELTKAKINSRALRKIIRNVIDNYLYLFKERLPEELLKRYDLPKLNEVIKNLHFPLNTEILEKARYRMKFEEMLFYQLIIHFKRQNYITKTYAPIISKTSSRARKLYNSLPFQLTKDQKKVLMEIDKDFKSGRQMNRLLQGDVGSGKTIVALLSILMAIDNGLQTAFMAPTELLAEQHYHTLKNLTKDLDVNIVHLVGGQKKKFRNEVLDDISKGQAHIIVGTHAMFQNEMYYNNLGYIIIDEQHRFGVMQRAELIKLGKSSFSKDDFYPHILVMSATPIPRTLSMTVYGDLDVSIIKTMPKNRKPIKTKVAFEKDLPVIYDFIKDEIRKGRQAFIVYPLVEKSEKLELKSAVEHYKLISEEIFPDLKCALLHGQMLWYEKEETMQKFLDKDYDILVATTVIEVGIDIPNATIMMVENAERFGLSQLHQLRGRVGRGAEQSYCILVTKNQYEFHLKKKADYENDRKTAILRLKAMNDTTDGFKIAEIDLKLRGPGDMLGTKQSGLPDFQFIDIINDAEIISEAKNAALEILSKDPEMKTEQNIRLAKQIQSIFPEERKFFEIA